ncbi:MAG: cyclic nucleotide-binding domain-containing protein [Halieaceae bacterium]|jgi:CRP-like cAMP-binding protein|nr:cyclic nucleotide-binding domain-containing protein [Halieaceae bacterium]
MHLPKSFLIAEMPLFDALSAAEVSEVEQLMIYRDLQKGGVIYKQGSCGKSVCFVVEGELSVIHRNEGKDVQIATVRRGEAVGELAIIDGLTRSADVVAATDASVLILKQVDFDRLVEEKPAIGVKMLKSLARAMSMTLRERSETLASLMHV